MKKIIGFVVVVIMSLSILVCGFAENREPTQAETASMEKLLPFIQKGLVIPANIDAKDTEGLVWVEPLLWKKPTHVEKYKLLKNIGAFYSVHNKLKGSNIKGAGASDITSKEILGFINIETGKVTIKK